MSRAFDAHSNLKAQQTFIPSPAAREHERQLLRLHQLLAEGKGESEEHEALCESMLDSWNQLDERTQALMRGLSGDLYMLQGEELLDKDSMDLEKIDDQLKGAWSRDDYDEVLRLLRKERPSLPPDRVAAIRGSCWSKLGFYDAALAFFKYASTLEPHHGHYVYMALETLVASGRLEEALENARVVAADKGASARGLFRAAQIIYEATCAEENPSADAWEQLAKLFERAAELELRMPRPLKSLVVGACLQLGFCCERLQRNEKAMRAYDMALQQDPDNGVALTVRGFLRMQINPEDASEDFERAVQSKVRIVFPYLYWAARCLEVGRYQDCVDVCEEGLMLAKKDSQRANFYEWLAIAKAALQYPQPIVEELFESALDLEPLNVRIRRNADVFRKHASSKDDAVSWEVANDTSPEEARRTSLEEATQLLKPNGFVPRAA